MAEEVMDFGFKAAETIKFKLQGVEYEASNRPPLGGLVEMVDEQRRSGDTAGFATTVLRLMELTLTPASYKKFVAAYNSTDPEKTIDLEQLNRVARWLMEQLVGRPTVSPDDSSD